MEVLTEKKEVYCQSSPILECDFEDGLLIRNFQIKNKIKMENQLSLTSEELGMFELALAETITVLKNRCEYEIEYIHPAKKYEDLYDKLTRWLEPLPVSVYSLSAVKDGSAYC